MKPFSSTCPSSGWTIPMGCFRPLSGPPRHDGPMGKMKHRIGNWIAGAFALMMVAGVLYLSFSYQVAGYDDYLACNPRTGISRLEWLFGVRPLEDCRR